MAQTFYKLQDEIGNHPAFLMVTSYDGTPNHAKAIWGGGSHAHDVTVDIYIDGNEPPMVNWCAMGAQPPAYAAHYGALIQLAAYVADEYPVSLEGLETIEPTAIDAHFEKVRNSHQESA